MSSQEHARRYRRARIRKRVLDVDLNALPPCENQDQDGTSFCIRSQDRQAVQEGAMQPPPIDVEAIDDDVIISSPREFAEARNNSRRSRGRATVIDVDSEERSSRHKRRRVLLNANVINLEGSSNSKKGGEGGVVPPAPPVDLTFSCPVCMGPLVEETSTKCGHIFCKACIKAAIAAQTKCPTCRRRTTARDLFRIYLPATGST